VHRFETALCGALLRGQSKKRHLHAGLTITFKELKGYKRTKNGMDTSK